MCRRLLATACLWGALTGGCAPALSTGPVRSLGENAPPLRGPAAAVSVVDAPRTLGTSVGQRIADAARAYLSAAPAGFRADCSGFVEAVLDRAGVPLRGSTAHMWSTFAREGTVHHRRLPRVGDLAFFDDTWDRNRNGRLDDDLTHLAVVIDVEDDGTIVMAHVSSSKGRTTLRMNLLRPDVSVIGSHRLNDHLRRSTGAPREPTLAAQLWRGFATPRDAR